MRHNPSRALLVGGLFVFEENVYGFAIQILHVPSGPWDSIYSFRIDGNRITLGTLSWRWNKPSLAGLPNNAIWLKAPTAAVGIFLWRLKGLQK